MLEKTPEVVKDFDRIAAFVSVFAIPLLLMIVVGGAAYIYLELKRRQRGNHHSHAR